MKNSTFFHYFFFLSALLYRFFKALYKQLDPSYDFKVRLHLHPLSFTNCPEHLSHFAYLNSISMMFLSYFLISNILAVLVLSLLRQILVVVGSKISHFLSKSFVSFDNLLSDIELKLGQ
jgi:hypothetical protein